MQVYLGEPYIALLVPAVVALALYNHRKSPSRSYVKTHSYWNPLVKHVAPPRRRRSKRLLLLEAVTLALVVLALASPTAVVTRKVPISSTVYGSLEIPASPGLVIVIDVSGSMAGAKLEQAKNAVLKFLERLNATVDTGLIAFNHQIVESIPPTDRRDLVRAAVLRLEADGGTMYSFPLHTAYNWLEIYRHYDLPAIVVMATDGLPADRVEYRRILSYMAEEGIAVFTIFIGSEQQGIEETRYIAETTGGKQYTAETAEQLVGVFEEVAEDANKIVENVTMSVETTVTVEHRKPLSPYLYSAAIILAVLTGYERYRASRLTF